MVATDAIQAWAEAFTAAQAEFPHISKDKTAKIKTKTGADYSYAYADLPTILEHVNPILASHGLAVAQSVVSNGEGVGVATRIFHKTGHVEEFGPVYLPAGDDARSAGSSITYSRRYSLCAALGIATEDDTDGAAATRSAPQGATTEPLNDDDPYCPACLAINGEKVGLYANDKKPFWRCKNKPGDCAGTTESNGKQYQWAGWDESWERSAQSWVDNHPEHGEQIQVEEPEESPGDWLKARVGIFKEWSEEERRQAYTAVMEELDFKKLSSIDRAQQVLDGMQVAYFIEHPASDERPF